MAVAAPASHRAPSIEVSKVAHDCANTSVRLAKFKVVIKNSGQVPITHLEVVDQYDTAFSPQRTDAGSQTVSPGRILWKIDRLDVGERREFNVEAACVTATSTTNRTCSRVTVTADDGINATQEKCVEILPLSSPVIGSNCPLPDRAGTAHRLMHAPLRPALPRLPNDNPRPSHCDLMLEAERRASNLGNRRITLLLGCHCWLAQQCGQQCTICPHEHRRSRTTA